ncbi:MAG: T9SS type A sorting domain-containing protein [Bacteroidetes bacterium]|nr:T9SS type A sorting domain-containing protein [Bacteroidota bacterium]
MKKQSTLIALILISVLSQAQLAWLKLPDFPGGERMLSTAFSINGKGYMGLGIDSNFQYHNDWYEYDPVANSWTAKTSLPGVGRDHATGIVVDSFGYVVCGEISGGATAQVWQYNPYADTWAQKSSLPIARENGTGFAVNGKAYYGTGFQGSTNLVDFYEYNPATNTWLQKTDVPGGVRAAGMSFSVNGKGYLGMGGNTNSHTYYYDFYEYDPLTNNWTARANYPMPTQNANTYHSSNAGYVLCGGFYQYSGITQNPLNLLYKYTPVADTWNLEGSFPGLPRGAAGGFSIGQDIYIGAGSQSVNGSDLIPGHTPFLNDFWKLALVIDTVALTIEDNGERQEKMFRIFPNPSHDYLTISTEVLNTLSRIRIYDIAGKLVNEISVTTQNTQLDISKLSSATYYAELVNKSNEIITGRFVKE